MPLTVTVCPACSLAPYGTRDGQGSGCACEAGFAAWTVTTGRGRRDASCSSARRKRLVVVAHRRLGGLQRGRDRRPPAPAALVARRHLIGHECSEAAARRALAARRGCCARRPQVVVLEQLMILSSASPRSIILRSPITRQRTMISLRAIERSLSTQRSSGLPTAPANRVAVLLDSGRRATGADPVRTAETVSGVRSL
jgi:hypothetical protein